MIATLLTLALAAGNPGDSHVQFSTGPDVQVELKNINGPISVTATPGELTFVDAVYSGPESGRTKWSVEIHGNKDKVDAQVCCGPCGAFIHGDCDDAGSVALAVRMPSKGSVSAANVSGPVSIDGVVGAVSVHEVSGAARVTGAESAVSVNTVSGAVKLKLSKVGPLALHSVSGDIDVALPKDGDADVTLHTVSGRLNGQRVGMGTSQTRVGNGGHPVSANTVSGNLDVHR